MWNVEDLTPARARGLEATASTREERPHRLEPSRRLSGFRVPTDAISALRVHAVVSPERPDRENDEDEGAAYPAHERQDRDYRITRTHALRL